MNYQEWIEERQLQIGTGLGKCREITKAMAEAFPELRRVRGHYHCWVWGKREHWWLMDGDEVVDPTAEQFPSKGQGRYEEWVEGQPEPTGNCINCGGYCFNREAVCKQACYEQFMLSLNQGGPR